MACAQRRKVMWKFSWQCHSAWIQCQTTSATSTLYNPITSHAPQISDMCSRVSEVDINCLLLSVVSIDGKGDCEYTSTQFWERIPLSCLTKIVTTLCAKYFRCRWIFFSSCLKLYETTAECDTGWEKRWKLFLYFCVWRGLSSYWRDDTTSRR